MSTLTINPYLSGYPDLATRLPGQNLPWLQQFRNEAFQRFSENGFPGNRQEEWRYTDLSALSKTLYAPTASQTVDVEWLNKYRLQNAYSVVLVNGHFSADLSRCEGLSASVTHFRFQRLNVGQQCWQIDLRFFPI